MVDDRRHARREIARATGFIVHQNTHKQAHDVARREPESGDVRRGAEPRNDVDEGGHVSREYVRASWGGDRF